jgi:hypothetical protein
VLRAAVFEKRGDFMLAIKVFLQVDSDPVMVDAAMASSASPRRLAPDDELKRQSLQQRRCPAGCD